MKITKMLFFAALGLWSPLCWGQSGPRVSGNLKSWELQLEYQNLSNPSDSLTKIIACASDRSFSFDLPDPEAAYTVKLSVPGTSAKLSFPVLPGESAEVKGWDTGWKDRPTQIGGSGFYMRWNELGKKVDSLWLAAMRNAFTFMEAARDRKNSESGLLGRLKQQADSITSAQNETVWNYMKEHPGDPVSIMALQYLQGEDIEKGFNLLDPSVREGALAPYALDLIGRYKKVVDRGTREKDSEAALREKAEKVYASAPKKKLEAGDTMPDVPFLTIDGQEVCFSSLKGKYVYIDFWTTWCAGCILMMPKVKKLEKAVKDGVDIVFVTVSLDEYRENWENFVKERKLEGNQWYAGGSRQVWEDLLSIKDIPRFVLLDKEGKIMNAKLDYASNPGAEKELKGLLGL